MDRNALRKRLSEGHDPASPIVFWIAWGQQALVEVVRSFESARKHIPGRFILFTDSDEFAHAGIETFPFDFSTEGFFRKAEVFSANLFPENADILFLDSDTVVLGSVNFGFSAGRQHRVSIVASPMYLLDEYRKTGEVLLREGIQSDGQLMLNSGVIFFTNCEENRMVFELWSEICVRNSDLLKGDQEALTMACEVLGHNPYMLSKSYNLRGIYEPVIGRTRIWHARQPPPPELNDYRVAYPPRILAKSKLRELRRRETHSDAAAYWLRGKIVNPLYRITKQLPVGRCLIRSFSSH
jgi:hypothetical protein